MPHQKKDNAALTLQRMLSFAIHHGFLPQIKNIGNCTSTVVPFGTCSASNASMAGKGSSCMAAR
jgi:hypothetical protein